MSESGLRHQWITLLRELAEVAEAALRAAPQSPPSIQADRVVCALAEYLGGQRIYLPDATSVRRAVRDARIWAEFDGRNIRELAARHSLGERQIYRILRRQREIERARRQQTDQRRRP